jgi:hypothetical protein
MSAIVMGIILLSTGIIQQLESSSGELATPQDQNVSNSYGDPTVFSRNYTVDKWHKGLELDEG